MAETAALVPTGLTTPEVDERVRDGRTNDYTAETSRTWWAIIRSNVFTLFNMIVFSCFLVLFALGRWQDALFGFAALGNLVIGSYQEIKAKLALDRLALLHAPLARVRRNNEDLEIRPGEVVADDILALQAGDQIPADAVMVWSQGLEVDESMLTGESEPVEKPIETEVMSGSVVVDGRGYALVTALGADAYAHRFADEARRFSMVRSDLRESINRVLRWVSIGIGPMALLVINSQIMVQGGWQVAIENGWWREAAVGSIGIIIAMIPLGLVLMTSITFAVSAAKLATSNVLMQELPAVEGLARVSVICIDKTGTLTDGNITFDHSVLLTDTAPANWMSAAAWFGSGSGANATSAAITTHFSEASRLEATRSIPFSSTRKWSAGSFGGDIDGTWVLGAPSFVFSDDDERPAAKRAVTEAAELAEQGLRVLVLAHSPEPLTDELVTREAIPSVDPIALLSLVEQVRFDAADTLRYFAEQGVDIKVISGDDPKTVGAIARRLGMTDAYGFDAQLLPTDVDELADLLEHNSVFGRVTPEQKKAMVVALQSRGHDVAMTGDGVNDALAMKQADIGIAMGSGSAATKAVARIVLLDGQFSHMPSVVAEGRQALSNMERVSQLFLTKTVFMTTLAFLFGVLIIQIPFLPRQLSVTDGLTIGIPAFFLALLPSFERYRPGFLKRSLSFAVPAGLIVAGSLLSYTISAGQIATQAEVRTGTTLLVAVLGLWILTLISMPINLIKGIILGAMVIGLWLIYTVPFSAQFFELDWPTAEVVQIISVVAVIGIALISVARWIQVGWLKRSLQAESR